MRYLILALLLSPTAHGQWTIGDCRQQINAVQALTAMNQGLSVYSCKRMTFKPTRQGIKIVATKEPRDLK